MSHLTNFLPTEKERIVYGAHFQEHMLRQYELYVAQLDTISTMRQKTNEFFLTLQTAFLGLVGYLLSTIPPMYHVVFLCTVGLIGILECYFWVSILLSYKNLKDAKFTLLHEWEKDLPLAVFTYEMQLLRKQPGQYVPLTKKEQYIPVAFSALYIVLVAMALYLWL